MTRFRRAGSVWRFQVHRMKACGLNGATVSVESQPHRLPASFTPEMREKYHEIHADHAADLTLPDTEFDELVVGKWLHVEQMDAGFWWMSIGGVVLHVKADRDGNPKRVTVHTAGSWDEPVDGCEYEVDEEVVELHEFCCPSCGATTRARLADQSGGTA